MLIKIIAGTFGHREGSRVVPVTAANGPIDVEDRIAARLLSIGVAEAVERASEAQADAGQQDDGEGVTFPEFDSSMTRAQLEEIALSVGIEKEELAKAGKKADVIALLEEARDEFESADAPTFDPEGDVL